MSGLFLQSSVCAGAAGVRDSGYDSLRRRMSVLDRITHTHPVWLLLTLSDEEAKRILRPQQPGVSVYIYIHLWSIFIIYFSLVSLVLLNVLSVVKLCIIINIFMAFFCYHYNNFHLL